MAKNATRRKRIDGVVYIEVLMKIQSRYEDGTPEDLTYLPDDVSVEICGGEEFLTAWVIENVIRDRG